MKIAILTRARTFAGAEQGVADLRHVLAGRGHDVSLVCLDDDTERVYASRLAGVAMVSLSASTVAEPTRRDWLRAFARRAGRADVAVFSKATLNQVTPAFDRAAKAWFGRLVTIENLQPPPVPAPSRRRILGLLPRPEPWRRRMVRRGRARLTSPDHIVACSRAVKEDLVRMYGGDPRKITVVTYGVDTDRFRPNPAARMERRSALGLTDSDFVLGTIRRVSYEKGIDLVVAAVAGLVNQERRDRLRFVIAGDGPDRASLEERMKADGLEAHVSFVGYVNDPERWYPAFDAFVIPSRVEALGIVALEALASGVPVIATTVGGLPEVFEGSQVGRLVSPDIGEIRAAIREVMDLSAAAREQEASAGRRHVIERYELTRQYSRMAAVIESVASGSDRH